MMRGLSERQTLPLLIEGCGTFSPCLCVCACTPPLAGGENTARLHGARCDVSGPLPSGSHLSPPDPELLFTGLSALLLTFICWTLRKHMRQLLNLLSKNGPMSQMPVCFLKVTYAVFHFAERRNHPTFPQYFLYCLILRDRWCVCV